MVAPKILVTGATGYIGSHACVALMQAGFSVVALDNFCNSGPTALAGLAQITGAAPLFVEADVRDRAGLDRLFEENDCAAVLHFAGLKAVGDSVEKPLQYFQNNVSGTVTLLEAMACAGVKRLIFSSSATVYGDPAYIPIRETAAVAPTNPYGRSKLMVEQIIADLCRSDPQWRAGILRYFNPAGAHPSGMLGENPNGTPNNLMPFVAQVAAGQRTHLKVFGNDYPTRDGTGVRDYLHVTDLAHAHLIALQYLLEGRAGFTVNLGTGQGHSVLEIVKTFEAASGRPVPYEMAPRRSGDIAACYADPSLAHKLLGWQACKTLDEMCADHWRWQNKITASSNNAESA